MFWKRKKIDEPVQMQQQPKQFERKQLTDNALKRELKEIRNGTTITDYQFWILSR